MARAPSPRLSGRTAIVTGAGRGIGAAIARRFAEEGASLVLGDLDLAAAQALAATLPAAVAVRADVAEAADAEALTTAAERHFGRLDILVNNAGIAVAKPFIETTQADIERIMRVNFTGAVLCAQAALRRMIPAGYGRVISISSVSGQRGNALRTAYGCSKAAIDQLTRIMTAELAAPGLTFNAIAPGAVDTELSAAVHDDATRRTFNERTPQGRYGTVDEIAAAALFLASEEAGYVCGQVLAVDGGYSGYGFGLAPPQERQA